MNSAKFTVTFQELNAGFKLDFGEIQPVSDGGYERGYEAGRAAGYAEGLVLLRQRADLSLPSYSDEGLEAIGNYAFYLCAALQTVDFPNCTSVGSYAFSQCGSLEKADFGSLQNLGTYAFQSCSNLTALIIRTPTLCKMGGLSAINTTPIAKGTGYIYVPATLLAQYKAGYNWSTYAAQIRAIEDYPEITGGGS